MEMKLPIAAYVAGLVVMVPFAAFAQTEHAAHHGAAAAPSAQAAMTNGVVKKVDKAAGSVTIAHEPLTNLGMPAMTMTFLVQDRAWLNGMKEGARIRFVANNVKGELTVVAVEQAK
jgi:Cu(I)/Ag(I) efflux system protein CusF